MDKLITFGIRWGAWPLIEMKNGSVRLRELRRLQRSQWDSDALRRARQLDRLRDQLSFCYEQVPYYRESWKAKPQPRSLQDLADVPLLTKDVVRSRLSDLVAQGVPRSQLIQAKTGGSTGVSLSILFDKECEERRNAMALLRNAWAGWQPAARAGALWGNPPVAHGLYETVRAWVNDRYTYLDTVNMSAADVERFLGELSSRAIHVVYGHAHSLFLVAQIARERRIPAPRVTAIVSTSMVLLETERTAIESYFGCRVTDRYGCEEVGLIASECEAHDGMHVNDEHLVVEIVREDGSPAEPGESGRVVVSDLINTGAPLVRYVVADVSSWRSGQCSCGRSSARIGRVEGRQADFLKRKDGRLVAGVSLVEKTLTAIAGIKQLQLIQPSIERIIARVVLASGGDDPASKQQLHDALSGAFSGDVTVDIEVVERLEQSGSGKYRFAICRC